MSECEHLRIQTWMHEARPAGLWSCVECGHKFVPLDLSIERERDEAVAALRIIAETDPIDAALDPQRAVRVASAVLAKIERGSDE